MNSDPASRSHECYSFDLVLSGALSDETVNSLYESGCDDATIAVRGGVARLVFNRESDSLENAIRSATEDAEKCGVKVVRSEIWSCQ